MGATGRRRRPYHHGDLRQALIDAAIAMIREGDIDAVSLRELARQVGVTYAAPYHHFADKNALLAELAADGFRALRAQMDAEVALLPVGADAIDRLGARGRGYIKFAAAYPAHYRVMFRRELRDRSAYPERYEQAQSCYGRLIASVTEVLAPGASEARIDALATTIWSTVHGAATLWIAGSLDAHLAGLSSDALADLVVGETERLLRRPA
jgi:AcrR family transcriptional regulator